MYITREKLTLEKRHYRFWYRPRYFTLKSKFCRNVEQPEWKSNKKKKLEKWKYHKMYMTSEKLPSAFGPSLPCRPGIGGTFARPSPRDRGGRWFADRIAWVFRLLRVEKEVTRIMIIKKKLAYGYRRRELAEWMIAENYSPSEESKGPTGWGRAAAAQVDRKKNPSDASTSVSVRTALDTRDCRISVPIQSSPSRL